MEKNHPKTIIKQLNGWNLHDSLEWENSNMTKRCQFFRHEIDSSLHLVIMEWIEPGKEAHTIIQFFCDPKDDFAKLKFVEEYMNSIDREK